MIRRSRAVWSGLVWMSLMLLASAGGRSYASGPTEQEPNDLRWDPAGRFAFTWDSIELSSKATNPDTNEDSGSSVPTRTLDISVKLDILDANDLVALYVHEPQVVEMVDEAGTPVRWVPQEPPSRRYYERFKPGYRWIDPWDHIGERGPWTLTVHVELEPNQPLPSLLSAVRGHVYAMYAEDVIEVDVPFVQTASTIIVARIEVFDPNSGWMDVGHDLQIRVLRAVVDCNRVSYQTEVRATSGSIQGLDFRGPSDFAAIETQLLDSDYVQRLLDLPSQYTSTSQGSDSVECGGYFGVFDVGGIRHRIAVRPVEVEIPFELTSIPVPSVEPVAE